MKKLLTLLIICITINTKADSWVQKASFPGTGLGGPFSFSIGNKGYVGCGRDSSGPLAFYNDFWEYDPINDSWTQKADFGGAPRVWAVGFSIGNKGYAGLGFTNQGTVQDFWEYDMPNNQWIQKANFIGGILVRAVGFSIGNIGYVGLGEDALGLGLTNKLWRYNPTTNMWFFTNIMPGALRSGPDVFVIGNTVYVIGGMDFNGNYMNEVWEYSTITGWAQKSNFPSVPRVDAASFSICGKGYIGVGENGSGGYYNDLWEYDPIMDLWNQKTNFPGLSRDEAAFFSIGNKGYIGLGGKDVNPFYSDFFEYTPDSACATGIADVEVGRWDFTIYPNPAKGAFTVMGLPQHKNVEIKMFDVKGKTVLVQPLQTSTGNFTIPVGNLPAGIYTVQVRDGENKAVRKVVVE